MLIRFILSYLVSCAALYLAGYGNLMNNMSESLAVTTFLFTAIIPAVLATMILTGNANLKNKIKSLEKRIDQLENKDNNDTETK